MDIVSTRRQGGGISLAEHLLIFTQLFELEQDGWVDLRVRACLIEYCGFHPTRGCDGRRVDGRDADCVTKPPLSLIRCRMTDELRSKSPENPHEKRRNYPEKKKKVFAMQSGAIMSLSKQQVNGCNGFCLRWRSTSIGQTCALSPPRDI